MKSSIGTRTPAFSLPDQSNHPVSLKDFSGKWLVLYFYPKDDTPGCTIEARDFTGFREQFHKMGAAIAGVSPDSPQNHAKFCQKYELGITLLCDEKREVLEKFGAWGLKQNYGKESMGVLRTTYLIDPQGRIAEVWRNVKADGHAQAVMEKLKELQGTK
ncbi:MAG: thioredoxin-dependent thiol peroxidase [Candidatus Diapherotrites archaeon]|nr:thioredoxin-dependent thiol peroxidase [Candidatus Diapherotrites archaeon]